MLAVVLVLALGIAGGVATTLVADLPQASADLPAPATAAPWVSETEQAVPDVTVPVDQSTLLLATTARGGGPANTLTLFSSGGDETPESVLFIPPGTLTEVPGVGLQTMASALQFGGAPLLQSSVEGALGIGIDQVAVVGPEELAAFFDRSGGLTVDVDQQLIKRRANGSARVRFEAGSQPMDGAKLADYWTFTEVDGEDLALFVRQQDLMETLLEALAFDEALRGRMLADGAPALGLTTESGWTEALFSALASAAEAGRLEFDITPVEPFGGVDGRGNPTFLLAEEELETFVATYLAPSVPESAKNGPVRVQVLNGVGTPGLAEAVDQALRGGGFRVVQTENANSFDYAETRILVYDERESTLERADRVRELLGTGSIQVSRQPQSMVDMSIVVGSDFAGGDETSPEQRSGRPE
ncbi:MAG: LCP family protein [Egibacteraceae bacterium]